MTSTAPISSALVSLCLDALYLSAFLVDAGVGTPSDATIAMEIGCDGVLMNTAIANAKNPILFDLADKSQLIYYESVYLFGEVKSF